MKRVTASAVGVVGNGQDGKCFIEPLEGRTLLAGDVVLHWNDVTIAAIRAETTQPGPGWASRAMAIVHLAIYDAVNAIDHGHAPYRMQEPAPTWASKEAAAATAAHHVLSKLYPSQKGMFDAALAEDMGQIARGAARNIGASVGKNAAHHMLHTRKEDGADVITPYEPSSEPGHWQPTPPQFTPAWGPGWGKVKTFALEKASQFRPAPPPALNSPEYTAAYDQVKSLGAADSATRTPEQTEIAEFWAYDQGPLGSPVTLFNRIVQQVAEDQNNSLVENARLFALTNIAMADAGIAAWEAKFLYDLWRPLTAIHNGDNDGNDDTMGDPAWAPLGAPNFVGDRFTPPFPAYVSGHSTFGGALFRSLELFYGTDDISFTIGSEELPGVMRSFESFSAAQDENGISRIYMGVHWSFDNTEGISTGRSIADYIFGGFFAEQAPHHPHDTTAVNVLPAAQGGTAQSDVLGVVADGVLSQGKRAL